MEFAFKTNNNMEININQTSGTNFEIRNLPQKEYVYIEKETKPCRVSFSANVLVSSVISAVFEEENYD